MKVNEKILRLYRVYKLKQEKVQLQQKHLWLRENGFSVVFDDRDKIKENIRQIDNEIYQLINFKN